MNENLTERFGRSRRGPHQGTEQVEIWIVPPQLNKNVSKYYEDAESPADGGSWLRLPAIPTSSELLDLNTGDDSDSLNNVEIATNRPRGAWDSKEDYLGAHYELLREDAVRPLREAVQRVKFSPQSKEDAFNGSIGIYEKVHICSVKCSPRGIAIRVTFSLFRAGKKILWEQSKRLISGSLVVLTPADDQFKTKAIVATVAARPLDGLRLNPPEIDLFIARAEESEIDPAKEFWMIEQRGSMYEADKHTLLALQRMMKEPFPLQEHLVNVKRQISAPDYVSQRPQMDMTAVLTNNRHETYENVDVLHNWPTQPHSELDASQLAALRRVLTKRLAVIQGPPGTGKTHISVQAIRIMLENRNKDDPPIVIACQTNHAVDQLLNHIAQFEPDFIRLGGRSKDKGIIKARTLYEVRKLINENPLAGSRGPQARKKMRDLVKQFKVLLSPLEASKQPLNVSLLVAFGIITEKQADSLTDGASQWVQSTQDTHGNTLSPFQVWLGRSLIVVPPKQAQEDFGFDFEEADLEFEQLKDLEAENANKDDDFEDLKGESFAIADNFTCRETPGVTKAKLQQALAERDMWQISEAIRPSVYRHFQAEMKRVILAGFRQKAAKYDQLAEQRRIGSFEEYERILKKQKIIGMTTTGLSKYRGLLASLQPKIVLIEEAAEVLEAPVLVACLPSLQHLILVGDHKQLRPHCNVKQHEDKPFYLNVSLFERLVNNRLDFDVLSKQRRMIPEIRRLLQPIYKDVIKDHASVLDPAKRPPVPGMGGINTWFFTHEWNEQRDELSSAYNPMEAEMIVGFVKYLMYNGMDSKQITLLTFYNGQRKKLLSELRSDPYLRLHAFNVVTVDSYQGEENDVVILSLVRRNSQNQIGFLNIDNRVCVALSRAKCGFYLFGDARLLFESSKTWNKVISTMANKGQKSDRLQVEPASRLDAHLPVCCTNHDQITLLKDPGDWTNIDGGCEQKCSGTLPCGHDCPLACHPFSHEQVNCPETCGKPLTCCGRPCKAQCQDACVCKSCRSQNQTVDDSAGSLVGWGGGSGSGRGGPVPRSEANAWTNFAKEEEPRYHAEVASINASRRNCAEKESRQQSAPLSDLSNANTMKQLSLELEKAALSPALTGPAPMLVTVEDKSADPEEGRKVLMMEEEQGGVAVAGHSKDWSKEGSLLD
ncbi:uncharacterized protein LTR77_005167 [Saxophila tyrrhenica]|uniref:P-loop containing nucleoside triphosphate hydrolase protein n=1 Tax=Saxophila tyrrhenica TaxID=1690608 RepID=A0AAV9PB36_9PEZI|nr:hypothetical protein LTR77_005167 [Saxophila tyrrhenica]